MFFMFYIFRRISNILHISGGFFHLSEPFKIDCAVFAPERKEAIKSHLTKITGGMWINVAEKTKSLEQISVEKFERLCLLSF